MTEYLFKTVPQIYFMWYGSSTCYSCMVLFMQNKLFWQISYKSTDSKQIFIELYLFLMMYLCTS